MKVVFSSDQRMLGALHVAMMTVLDRWEGAAPEFLLLSDDIGESDQSLLHETLNKKGKPYSLEVRKVTKELLTGLPNLNGSVATYYRLFLPRILTEGLCLYIDADTLCQIDFSRLADYDLDGRVVAMCVEAPIRGCADEGVKALLGKDDQGSYFNAGVILLDCRAWQAQNITEKCLTFIAKHGADFHDQSALNYVLHGRIRELPADFNRQVNVRTNWPLFRPPQAVDDCLVHFVDYPKPWSSAGRLVHMLGPTWWGFYSETAHFRDGEQSAVQVELSRCNLKKYLKALKDRVLFFLYCRGFMTPKGVGSLETLLKDVKHGRRRLKRSD